MNYIQECMVCKGKWRYTFDKSDPAEVIKEKLSLIRASCSPCGHQGLFNLLEKEVKLT